MSNSRPPPPLFFRVFHEDKMWKIARKWQRRFEAIYLLQNSKLFRSQIKKCIASKIKADNGRFKKGKIFSLFTKLVHILLNLNIFFYSSYCTLINHFFLYSFTWFKLLISIILFSFYLPTNLEFFKETGLEGIYAASGSGR